MAFLNEYFCGENKVLTNFWSFSFVLIQKETEASVAKKSRNPETRRASVATLKQRDFGWTQNLSHFSTDITVQYFKKEVAI